MRVHFRSFGSCLAVSAALLGVAGCDGSSGTPAVSTSTEEVTVKGVVRIGGKPAKGKEISFDPANIKRRDAPTARIKTGDDGSYTLKTLTGENAVSVQGVMNVKRVNLHSGENTEDVDF